MMVLACVGTTMDGHHPDDHPWIRYMDGWMDMDMDIAWVISMDEQIVTIKLK
jgi:hypothetical protein